MDFYHEGEAVIAHGPNPYVALYYISCPSRKKLDQVTNEFFASMTTPSLDGKKSFIVTRCLTIQKQNKHKMSLYRNHFPV